MSQLDKTCPIANRMCVRNCTFFIPGESDIEDKCQISEYLRQHTPNGKSSTRLLLEGSDKKV